MKYVTIGGKQALIVEDDDELGQPIMASHHVDILIVSKQNYSIVWEALVPTLKEDGQIFIL